MRKITEEQKIEIEKLRNEGKTIKQIAKQFNVAVLTIQYHLSKKLRDRLREYGRERYRQMSPEQKKVYFEKKREYLKNYQRNKYHNNEEYRKKRIEWSKQYQKEKNK
jgi:transposase